MKGDSPSSALKEGAIGKHISFCLTILLLHNSNK